MIWRRMTLSGMSRCVIGVRTDVSGVTYGFHHQVDKNGELGTTLAVTRNQSKL
jgi:hypothetical protein